QTLSNSQALLVARDPAAVLGRERALAARQSPHEGVILAAPGDLQERDFMQPVVAEILHVDAGLTGHREVACHLQVVRMCDGLSGLGNWETAYDRLLRSLAKSEVMAVPPSARALDRHMKLVERRAFPD